MVTASSVQRLGHPSGPPAEELGSERMGQPPSPLDVTVSKSGMKRGHQCKLAEKSKMLCLGRREVAHEA